MAGAARGIDRRALLAGAAASFVTHRAWSAGTPLRLAFFDDYAPISFVEAGAARGLLVDACAIVCRRAGLDPSAHPGPWARMQRLVRDGALDAFCTTPTPERVEYAVFCQTPLIILRAGIIHRRDDARAAAIGSLADLRGFRIADYIGNQWAYEVWLPGVEVDWVPQITAVLGKIAAGRDDIKVGGEITAPYNIRAAGLEDKLTFTPVGFLEPAPFVLGVRRSLPGAVELAARLEPIVAAFVADGERDALIGRYG